MIALVEPRTGETFRGQPGQPSAGELGEPDVEATVGQDLEPQPAAGAKVEPARVAGVAVAERDQVDSAELPAGADERLESSSFVLGVEHFHRCS